MNRETRDVLESPASTESRSATAWASVIVLTVITLLAFVNAGHESLIFDDKAFVGPDRTIKHESLGEAFNTDLWHNATVKGLYRPLLLINFELENRLFTSWPRGFHLVNIALHLAASLLLLGFLRCLLLQAGARRKLMELAALIAALVFAVHPVHTEVINSVFNRSSIYVSICAIAGLWWLFSRLETRPASAWLGLGIAYSIGILFKESALVIPGLAVALIVILTPGSAPQRIRRFLPVFWLLLPIAAYFYLRFNALAPEGAEGDYGVMLDSTRLPGEETLLSALGSMGQALKLMAWPWPLQLYHDWPAGTHLAALVAGQAVLAVAAIALFIQGRPALAAGLAFFYIAYLPASRLISMDGANPHLAERYIYFPSIGLAIVLAFALYALARRVGPRPIVLVSLPVLLLLSAVTWDRNHDWVSALTLFETEYQRGYRGTSTIRILTGALFSAGQFDRVTEICDENEDRWPDADRFSITCAAVYLRQDRNEDGVRALEVTTQNEDLWLEGRLTLGNVLIKLGRKQEGADHYAYAINQVENLAHKELYKGVLYVKLYPTSQAKLTEARAFFVKALELDPELEEAQDWVDHLDSTLIPEAVLGSPVD